MTEHSVPFTFRFDWLEDAVDVTYFHPGGIAEPTTRHLVGRENASDERFRATFESTIVGMYRDAWHLAQQAMLDQQKQIVSDDEPGEMTPALAAAVVRARARGDRSN